MERKRFVLVNDFHGTEAVVMAEVVRRDRVSKGLVSYIINKRQWTQALDKLCPSHRGGCQCGGTRGGQWSVMGPIWDTDTEYQLVEVPR